MTTQEKRGWSPIQPGTIGYRTFDEMVYVMRLINRWNARRGFKATYTITLPLRVTNKKKYG